MCEHYQHLAANNCFYSACLTHTKSPYIHKFNERRLFSAARCTPCAPATHDSAQVGADGHTHAWSHMMHCLMVHVVDKWWESA